MKLLKKCSGNWDIYLGVGNRLMAIPNEQGIKYGCKSSGYGTREYIATMMNNQGFDWDGFTDEGIEHFTGLAYKVLCHHCRPMIRVGYRFATSAGI